MSFLRAYWYIPAFVVLCIIAGAFLIYSNRPAAEPKVIYEMPKKTGRANLNTSHSTIFTAPAMPSTEAPKQIESNIEHTEPATEPVEQPEQVTPKVATIEETLQPKSDDTISDEELQRRLDEAAKLEAYLVRETSEYNALMSEFYDMKANDLRSKSLSERRAYLEEYRADLEDEAEDDDTPELIDEVVDMFIGEMNKRGVYFE